MSDPESEAFAKIALSTVATLPDESKEALGRLVGAGMFGFLSIMSADAEKKAKYDAIVAECLGDSSDPSKRAAPQTADDAAEAPTPEKTVRLGDVLKEFVKNG